MILRMAYLQWMLGYAWLLGDVTTPAAATVAALPYDYYDLLRQNNNNNNTQLQQVDYAPAERSTSNVVKLKQQNNNETIRLVHMASFLPFEGGGRTYTFGEFAAILMAMHRFNNNPFDAKYFKCTEDGTCRDNSTVTCDGCPEFVQKQKTCNVRLTTEAYDTLSDEVTSAAKLGTVLERKPGNLTNPRPSTIVGAYRSSITSPLAILAGIEDVAEISGASSSAYLDDQEVYPLFARTIASSDGEASAIVDYYVNLGVSRVSILYISDAFGSALQRNFEEVASAVGMETTYAGYVGKEDIPTAIQQIKASKYQHVFCIAFEGGYEIILEEAYKAGVADGNHAWLFYGPLQDAVQTLAKYEKGSALYEANKGVAIFNFESVPTTSIQYPGPHNPVPLPEIPETATEEFLYAWKEIRKDAEFLKYLKTKTPPEVPVPDDVNLLFPEFLSVFAHFFYDAITAMAIAMCQTDEEFFIGQDLIDQFSSIYFEGISGYVRFNEVNTREHTTIRFTVWNLVPAGDEEAITTDGGKVLHRFLLSPTSMYALGQWKEIRPFVYADGRTVPPADLTPVKTSTDDLNNTIRYVGLSLSVVMMALFVYCMVWTLWLCRDEPIVRASQPSFLMLIAFGSLVQAASIFPLSMNHTKNQDTNDMVNFEISCIAVPWLFYMGLSFTCAGLYCKVRRIYEIYCIPELDRLLVEKRDFIFWSCLMAGMNAFVLALWTALSPLKHDIVPDGATDVFGRFTSSHGVCRSEEHDDPNPFWLAILVVNVFTLLIGNWFSYRTRAIETEYQESQFIGFSLGTIIESLVIGSAMQHATRDTPDAYYVITIGSIFLTSFVVAALIFIPKIVSLSAERREKKMLQTRNSFRITPTPEVAGHQSSSSDDDSSAGGHTENENAPRTSGDFVRVEESPGASRYNITGVRILHHPGDATPYALNPYGGGRAVGSNRSKNDHLNYIGTNVHVSGITLDNGVPLHNSGRAQ